MKNFMLLAIGILFSTMTFAQPNSGKPEDYSKYISVDFLQKHLTVIAGAEMEGRETGTEGQRKAAAYIQSQFEAFGLKHPKPLNGYQQYYDLYQDSLMKYNLQVGRTIANYGTDYIIPLNNELASSSVAKSVIFAGYGIDDKKYSDYKKINVKNKAVVIVLGEPKDDKGNYIVSGTKEISEWTYPGIEKKVKTALKKGASAVLLVSTFSSKISERSAKNSINSNLYFPSADDGNNYYALISHDFGQQILGTAFTSFIDKAKKNLPFDKKDYLETTDELSFGFQKYRKTTKASNVLGVVEGTDKKDEYVFVTGHYDHLGMRNGVIYYGADDDGSGTVAVMAMANAFQKAKDAGFGPRRTMVFMTVSGEEKGLWGSEYYSDNPVYPLAKTTVDLNIDMIGRIDTERKLADTMNYVYVVGHDKLSSELPIINEGMNNKYTKLTLDYKFDDPKDPNRIYFRSDHYNFARKGVPVLFFYDGMLQADYHKPTDTVDKITWELYQKRALMVYYTAWEMANRDKMLKRDIPLDPNLKR